MYGFALRECDYPLLPAGLGTLTPLLFNVMCVLSAQRIPTFHDSIGSLVAEYDAERPVDDGVEYDADPMIDIELGIGPEEITGIALHSMFASEPEQASSALYWARGLGKVSVLGPMIAKSSWTRPPR